MGERCVFCYLCGVLIRRRTAQPENGQRTSWQYEARAVTTEQNRQPPLLTGVGLILHRHSFFAPEDHNGYYNTAPAAAPSVNWTMNLKSQHPVILFHHACWKLWRDQLRALCGHSNKTKTLVAHFYNLARCFPRDRLGQVCRADGYGGAMSAWALPQNPIESWEFLKAEPHALNPSSVPSAELPCPDDVSMRTEVLCPEESSTDIFSKLPYDVALALIEMLPTSDVCSLRLTSRTLAWLTHAALLPQSFWRSRFFADEETAMLCDRKAVEALSPSHDWRSLYFGVQKTLRDTSRRNHARNRRRVWRCIRPMTECLIALLEQNSTSSTSSALATQRPEDCRNGQVAHGCVFTTETGRQPAADLLSTKYVPLDTAVADLAMCVSSIEFDGAVFISGFRLLNRSDDEEICRLGLVFPDTEVRLEVPTQLDSIRVATLTNGIVGLEFPHPDETKACNVGFINTLPAGAGVTTLKPEEGHHVAGLMVGLDAVKILSIKLIERPDKDPADEEALRVPEPPLPPEPVYSPCPSPPPEQVETSENEGPDELLQSPEQIASSVISEPPELADDIEPSQIPLPIESPETPEPSEPSDTPESIADLDEPGPFEDPAPAAPVAQDAEPTDDADPEDPEDEVDAELVVDAETLEATQIPLPPDDPSDLLEFTEDLEDHQIPLPPDGIVEPSELSEALEASHVPLPMSDDEELAGVPESLDATEVTLTQEDISPGLQEAPQEDTQHAVDSAEALEALEASAVPLPPFDPLELSESEEVHGSVEPSDEPEPLQVSESQESPQTPGLPQQEQPGDISEVPLPPEPIQAAHIPLPPDSFDISELEEDLGSLEVPVNIDIPLPADPLLPSQIALPDDIDDFDEPLEVSEAPLPPIPLLPSQIPLPMDISDLPDDTHFFEAPLPPAPMQPHHFALPEDPTEIETLEASDSSQSTDPWISTDFPLPPEPLVPSQIPLPPDVQEPSGCSDVPLPPDPLLPSHVPLPEDPDEEGSEPPTPPDPLEPHEVPLPPEPPEHAGAVAHLWYPGEPGPEYKLPDLTSFEAIDQRTGEPSFFINMDFGGPDGSKLAALVRIVATHETRVASLYGLTFVYDDGSEKTFLAGRGFADSRPHRGTIIEQSMAIDGPGGERIIEMQTSKRDKAFKCCVRKLRMRTNRDRFLDFEFGGNRNCDPDPVPVESHPEAGCLITGIVAQVRMRTERIEQIKPYGVVSEPKAPALPVNIVQTPQVSRAGLESPLARIPHNIYWNPDDTFPVLTRKVSLKNIRKIRVSRGAPQRIRGPHHLSGLCFEFHDQPCPVYLGQWFQEVASFDIAEGERITGFTFWQTQELRPEGPVPFLQGNPGQLAGMKIEKTGQEPKSLEVCLTEKAVLMRYAFSENPWQQLENLCWDLNHAYDFLRCELQPMESQNSEDGLFLHSIEAAAPRRPTSEQLFWELKDEQGKLLGLKRIHVFFNVDGSLICGLSFEYSGGTCRSAGYVDGPRKTLDLRVLRDGESLVRFSWKSAFDDAVVRFHTNLGRTFEVSQESPISLADAPRALTHGDKWDVRLEQPWEEHGDAIGSEGAKVECVGVWVQMKLFPRGSRWIWRMGAAFMVTNKPVKEEDKAETGEEAADTDPEEGKGDDSGEAPAHCNGETEAQ